MEISWLLLVLSLALLTAALSVVAQRTGYSSPILALCVGAAVSFGPGLPTIELDPQVVLLLLLPPLLYASGVGMSWRGFRKHLRAILLLAVGCVLFTASAVAAVVHYAFGMTWAVGFVLGAIVSPPDAVAPMAILRRWQLPNRLLTVLEGESLVNDATALVLFSFALNAVTSGAFSPAGAGLRFLTIVSAEIVYGAAMAWGILLLRNVAGDARAEVLLSLATPFIVFWLPHELGGSGVIACVTAGLWVSWNGRTLIQPATRLQGYFIWGLVTWAIETLVFLLTGLQASRIFAGLTEAGWERLLLAGALISFTVIVVRFVWVFPATYLPWIWRRGEGYPDWRLPFLVGYTGLRGVVSLAAALSIPLVLEGRPFPDHDIVLFTTFCVILVTLVGQGGLLPCLVRRLDLAKSGEAEALLDKQDERRARIGAIDDVLVALDACGASASSAPAAVALLRHHRERRDRQLVTADATTPDDPVSDLVALQLELLNVERTAIGRSFAENLITDEARRRIERELDLSEAKILLERDNSGNGPRSDE